MPGLVCPLCGAFAGYRRVPVGVDDFVPVGTSRRMPLPMSEWKEMSESVHAANPTLAGIDLQPGDLLGRPTALIMGWPLRDIMHSFPGQLVVSECVLAALRNAQCSGYEPIRMDVRWDGCMKLSTAPPPTLYLLAIVGVAWRKDIEEDDLLACDTCHRMTYPHPDWREIDEARWDGSDFFNVDHNHGKVFVTERVCSTLAEHGYSNYVCVPTTRT